MPDRIDPRTSATNRHNALVTAIAQVVEATREPPTPDRLVKAFGAPPN